MTAALLPLPEDDDTLIPAAKTSAFIGLQCQTLARRRCEGLPPSFVRLGRLVFYRAGDLRKWLYDNIRTNTIK
jgi:hypothetical protein